VGMCECGVGWSCYCPNNGATSGRHKKGVSTNQG
jgi:hypothetical protein